MPTHIHDWQPAWVRALPDGRHIELIDTSPADPGDGWIEAHACTVCNRWGITALGEFRYGRIPINGRLAAGANPQNAIPERSN